MKFVIDTEEMKQNIQKNFEHFNTKLNTMSKQSKNKRETDTIEKLENELDYAKMMIDWNEKRIKEGKGVFVPSDISKSTQRLILYGVDKLENKLQNKEDV